MLLFTLFALEKEKKKEKKKRKKEKKPEHVRWKQTHNAIPDTFI